jgi:hypothetical protein
MKPLFKTLCITFFSLFLICQIVSAEETITDKPAVGIKQLMNNADQYPDNIIVHGIVSKVFPQDNLIGLIDSPKTIGCDVKKCAKNSDKSCSKTTSKEAAPKCAKNCEKACTKSSSEASAKTCPMKAEKSCTKPCQKDAGKTCVKDSAKTCPKSSDKGCAKTCSDKGFTLTLPVQWDGNMPEPSSDVRVVGKITHKNGRLLFVADSVNVMSN